MKLRKGKTKNILNGAVDSALLAVEVYNKPRTTFRTQAYVSLMIMAWTRLLHAHFNHTIGDKYYYKKRGSTRYETVDGERKTWDLKTCINKYGQLSASAKANLELFIKLRNKIEHRNIDKREMDVLIFGECQSLLFNFEQTLIELFGEEYGISENLVYSLQFSALRKNEQTVANKRVLSRDFSDIKKFVDNYRSSLSDKVFNSQEYSIKLIQIPKIANTNRSDLAIEFVRWDSLSKNDKKAYKKLDAIIKDNIVKQPVVNSGGMKPSKVLEEVEKLAGVKLSHHDHKCLLQIFSVRPDPNDDIDPFNTNPEYCVYDELHNDYVYYQPWIDCLIRLLKADKMKKHMWTQNQKQKRRYNIDEYI